MAADKRKRLQTSSHHYFSGILSGLKHSDSTWHFNPLPIHLPRKHLPAAAAAAAGHMSAQVDAAHTIKVFSMPAERRRFSLRRRRRRRCYCCSCSTFVSSPVGLSVCGLLRVMKRDVSTTRNPSGLFKEGFPGEPRETGSFGEGSSEKTQQSSWWVCRYLLLNKLLGRRMTNWLTDQPNLPSAKAPFVSQVVGLNYFMGGFLGICALMHGFFQMILNLSPL